MQKTAIWNRNWKNHTNVKCAFLEILEISGQNHYFEFILTFWRDDGMFQEKYMIVCRRWVLGILLCLLKSLIGNRFLVTVQYLRSGSKYNFHENICFLPIFFKWFLKTQYHNQTFQIHMVLWGKDV